MKKLEAIIPPFVNLKDLDYYRKEIDSLTVYEKGLGNSHTLFLVKSLEYDSAENNVFLCGVNLKTKETSKISAADFVYFNPCSFVNEKDEELITKELGLFAGYIYNKALTKDEALGYELALKIKTEMETFALTFINKNVKNNLNVYFDESLGIEINNNEHADVEKKNGFVKTDMIFNNNKEDSCQTEQKVESLEPILE